MRSWIAAILLIVPFYCYPAQAQNVSQIEIDPSDNPLVIDSWLDQNSSFIGTLRLTSQDEIVRNFIFLPSDLRHQDGNETIARQQISIIGEPNLVTNIPQDFQIIVDDIELPGIYEGEIKLLLPGQALAEAQSISLTLIARARPTLNPLDGTSQVQLNLVNCGWGPDCHLAYFLLDRGAFQDSRDLRFDNPIQSPISLVDIQVVIEEKQTGYQLTEKQIELPMRQQILPPNQIVSLPLILHRSSIPPGRYVGSIYLTLEGLSEKLVIPIDIKIRSGPFIPFIALFLGIIIGRLVKYMEKIGEPLSNALDEIDRLKNRIQHQAHLDDQKILTEMADDARQLIIQGNLKDQHIELSSIALRMQYLNRLRQMDEQLATLEPMLEPKDFGLISKKISNAKMFLKRRPRMPQDDVQVGKLMSKLQENLDSLGIVMSNVNAKEKAVLDINDGAKDILNSMNQSAVNLSPHTQSQNIDNYLIIRQKLKGTLVFMSGITDNVRVETTRWLVRPLFSLFLLVGLSTVGLNSFYVKNGETFGANPFTDFSGLILWGLSADVASRSLSSLRNNKDGKDET